MLINRYNIRHQNKINIKYMSLYREKYIKYKKKCTDLENQIGGDDNVHSILCDGNSDKKIFYKLLLQLLVEYYVINEEPPRLNNDFMSLTNFMDYYSPSITSLISHEETGRFIKYISENYRHFPEIDDYKKQLTDNQCLDDFKKDTSLDSFFDCRNYSIFMMVSTLMGVHDCYKYPPTLVYKLNENNIIDGHVFVLNQTGQDSIEAISIQVSLCNLLQKKCKEIGSGISVKLFNYILNKIVPDLQPKYCYAKAWPSMSNILKHKFGFSTITKYIKEQDEMDITEEQINGHIPQKYVISDKNGNVIITEQDGSSPKVELLLNFIYDVVDDPYILTAIKLFYTP